MAFLIKVKQPTQIQIKKNGDKKTKTLLPSTKYVIDDCNNKQIIDLKLTKCLSVKQASLLDESFYDHLELS